MPSRIGTLLFVVLVFTFQICRALQPAVHHPLDGLTPDEYWKVYNTLNAAGKLAETTQFSSILFQEPPKVEVLAGSQASPSCAKLMWFC